MKVTKRLVGFVAAMAMCAVMLLPGLIPGAVPGVVPQAQAAEKASYSLYVCGTRVTSDNADDILGDGTASFVSGEGSSGTLTLNRFAVSGQAGRGPFTTMNPIMAFGMDLTINLEGDNAIALGSNGRAGIHVPGGTITFTGDGNLYVGGGIYPENAGTTSGNFQVFGNLGITFAEGFTGTVVVQGPNVGTNIANPDSIGIYSNGPIVFAGGTVISTGGTCTEGSSIGVKAVGDMSSVQVTGGTLIAQGGIAAATDEANAIGVVADEDTLSVTGGALVARGGVLLTEDGLLPEAGLATSARAATTSNVALGEGMSVLGEVGYVDGSFSTDAAALANGGTVTGIAVGPSSFTRVDELSVKLTGDVYHISTDGTNFATGVEALDTAGHTALFVNLFETTDTETYTNLNGCTFASNAVSLTGMGKVVSVGGLAFSATAWEREGGIGYGGFEYPATSGVSYNGLSAGLFGCSDSMYNSTALTVDGPTVVGVGGLAGGGTNGCVCKSFVVNSGNLVGVGGTGGPKMGDSAGGNSFGMTYSYDDPQLSAYGTSKVLGVGGATGHNSWGLQSGYANSYDEASVMGVGGPSRTSEGVFDTAYAYGGTVFGIGGCATSETAGCNSGVVSYPGGKVVALGGVFTDEGGCSYGSWTTPYGSHAGDLLVAGRSRAYSYYESYGNYSFGGCAEGATGVAWTDYDGTQDESAISYETRQSEIANYKRIVVNARYTRTIAFEADGGTGTMKPVEVDYGATYELPDCTFGEPAFKRFSSWDKGTPGTEINVTKDTVVTAQWADSKWTRVAGSTRYNTMRAIVQQAFPSSSSWAVVATGENFPDALSASALAGFKQCPVILTKPEALTSQAKSELQRLGVKNVYIMGGTGAVSTGVESAIKKLNGGVAVTRVAGNTRRATAVEAMKIVKGKSDTVIVATGENYADSLSIGPWSYLSKSPIVLTKKDGTLDAATVNAIKSCGYKKYVIVGGTNAVASSVESQLNAAGLKQRVKRLAGNTRYATSKLIAQFSLNAGMRATYPAVATGENFPDALAAAPMQGMTGSVMVLVKNESSAGIQLLSANASALQAGYVLGGKNAISQPLMDYIRDVTEGNMSGQSADPDEGTEASGLAAARW